MYGVSVAQVRRLGSSIVEERVKEGRKSRALNIAQAESAHSGRPKGDVCFVEIAE